MLYAFLCYHDEDAMLAWSAEEGAAVMAGLGRVCDRLGEEGRMGPSLSLMPTTAATTLIKGKDLVLDGPYAETKEALLGFYVIDCDSLEHALAVARELGEANACGAYEIRPVRLFEPGVALDVKDRV
jgi:hypothetical protein